MEHPPRIVYVCSLCLRQYDLQEDLRGHMVYFHGCEPIQSVPGTKTKSAKPTAKQQHLASRNAQDKQILDLQVEDVDQVPSELQPMPFKDFRLVLRANMQVP